MIKRKYKILLITLLVLICTAFIFSNSLKNAEESRADSDVIVELVKKAVGKLIPVNDLDLNYIVRKGAHLFEFFVLGVFSTLLYLRFRKKRRFTVGFVFVYVTAIAFLDEFIQRFTGRGSCFSDVVIDFVGATIGICFILLLCVFIGHGKSCTNSDNDSIQENIKQ